MSQKRADSFVRQSTLSRIRDRALQLSRLNQCLAKQLPLSINTVVKLVNIDTRKRAVLHVKGAEWATHVRMQQRMILTILQSCGRADIQGVLVKNRPLEDLAEEDTQPRRVHRNLSQTTRDLVEASAASVSDERLAHSLRRLARKKV